MNAPHRPERTRPADHLARAALATALASSENGSALDVIQHRWNEDLATAALVTRTAVNPASTGTSAWAGAYAQAAVGDFIASLTESAAAKLIAAGKRVSLDGVHTTTFPRRQGEPSSAIPWVAEGGAIPVKQYVLEGVTVGPTRKLASIAALTSEVARSANGEQVIATLLREDVSLSLDASMFSATAASSIRPAGILNGVAALTATAGGGDAALLADIENLAAAASIGGGTEVVFIASPRQAMALRLRIGNVTTPPVWTCSTLAAGTVIAVAPAAFVSAFGAEPQLSQSTEAVLHFEDTNPLTLIGTAGTPNTVAAPLKSAFQSDLIGVKMILDAAWAMRTSNSVAWLSGATWG